MSMGMVDANFCFPQLREGSEEPTHSQTAFPELSKSPTKESTLVDTVAEWSNALDSESNLFGGVWLNQACVEPSALEHLVSKPLSFFTFCMCSGVSVCCCR